MKQLARLTSACVLSADARRVLTGLVRVVPRLSRAARREVLFFAERNFSAHFKLPPIPAVERERLHEYISASFFLLH